jgi:hypothetical protein
LLKVSTASVMRAVVGAIVSASFTLASVSLLVSETASLRR